MSRDADLLRKLKALARDRGATAGERAAARVKARLVERRIILGTSRGNGGWRDPANKAHYAELKAAKYAADAAIVKFAKKMMQQSREAETINRRVNTFGIVASRVVGMDALMRELDRVFENSGPF